MFARIAVAVAAVVALSGCGGGITQINYKAYRPLNVQKGSPDSTVVTFKLLFLKDAGKFKSKTYDELWEDPKKALEEDLLGMKEFSVDGDPSQKDARIRHEAFAETKPEVRFIGLVGNFSKATEAGPRQIVVSKDEAKSQVFHITDYHIELRPE